MHSFGLEILLSGNSNRDIFQILWYYTYSSNNKKDFERLPPISTICHKLSADLDDITSSPSKFYFKTKLVFATVNLYRDQVNKLLSQVKQALEDFNRKFIKDEDWLTKAVAGQTDENSVDFVDFDKNDEEYNPSNRRKTGEKTLKKIRNKKTVSDFDLIEKAFHIDDDVIQLPRKKLISTGKGKKKVSFVDQQNGDPNVVRIEDITLKEKINLELTFNNARTSQMADDFEEDYNDDLLFDLESIYKKNDTRSSNEQVVPDHNQDIEMSNEINCELPASYSTVQQEVSLEDEVRECLADQKLPQTRQSAVGLESRIDEMRQPMEIENDEYPISAIHEKQEELEQVVPKSRKVSTTRAKKRKLIIDKVTRIQTIVKFDDSTMNSSVIDNFPEFLFNLKMKNELDNLLTLPTTHYHTGKVVTIFKRNWKTIPQYLNRTKFDEAGDVIKISSPKRAKRPFESEFDFYRVSKRLKTNEETSSKQNKEIIEVSEIPVQDFNPNEFISSTPFKGSTQQEIVSSGNTSVPLQILEKLRNEETQLETNIEISENVTKKMKKNLGKPLKFSGQSEKIVRRDIMKKLKFYWENARGVGDLPITMKELCSDCNVMIAARTFQELMFLSKFEAVELFQGDDLTISDIKKGRKCKFFMN